MSIQALAEYIRYSKYAQQNRSKKRRDNWKEQVDKMFDMHEKKLGNLLNTIHDDFYFTKNHVMDKKVLGSQRALQFGGDPILKKEARIYNCTASYADRVDFFSEGLYLLLCGCGVGFSVQKHHIDQLPEIHPRGKGKVTFTIPDSIEGWADAFKVLLYSYFKVDKKPYIYDWGCEFSIPEGFDVEFDFSLIRPKGSRLSWGGKAPGPDGLKKSLERSQALLERLLNEEKITRLRPIHAYDIFMYAADAVLSGGVRRSATICLFSPEDMEMAQSKTGKWMKENPQRARSNNSVLLMRDKTTPEMFKAIIENSKAFGEPGFVFADDPEFLVNPCCEIGLYAKDEEGNSGWQMCNLCEINVKKNKTPEEFLETCKAAAILGTIQASYTNIDYLGPITKKILDREALLGVSMTGMMDCPEVAFDAELQRKGAQLILDTNERIAKAIGINPCARSTCVKPAGTSSLILETANGIHPQHARRYFRRVQANNLEFPARYFAEKNPLAVEKSVWSSNDSDIVLTFLCEVPPNAITKNNVSALDLLNFVKKTQDNWVSFGTRKERCVKPWLKHNVSNTITVLPEEWDDVEKFIFDNRDNFTGISLLSGSGDKDYPQAPFATVYTPKEIVNMYGDGSLMASGLIVDGQHAFKNLWNACDCLLGIGEVLPEKVEPFNGSQKLNTELSSKEDYIQNQIALLEGLSDFMKKETLFLKVDWIRRAKQFAQRYFDGDIRKMTYCLKDVHNWKLWCDLKREYVDIDWSKVVEDDYQVDVSSIGAEACAGGSCEVIRV